MNTEASSCSWLIIAPLNTRCNKFSFYWPDLNELDIPTPATRLIPLEKDEKGNVTWNTERIIAVMEAWGANRAFVRSDYKAAPNRLYKGSYIPRQVEEEVDRTVTSLLNQLSAAGWDHGEVLVLREWLDLNFCTEQSHISCHPEVRFFIEDGEVIARTDIKTDSKDICNHLYEHLEEVIEKIGYEIPQKYAYTVADHFNRNTWAVDFVLDTNGDWYCTEMGLNAVRWDREGENWINHCDHGELEPMGPSEIHSAALYKAKSAANSTQ